MVPIGTAVALAADNPFIYPRKGSQGGTGWSKFIEGAWQPGDRVAIIEDLITSGGSTVKTAETLRCRSRRGACYRPYRPASKAGRRNLAQAGISAHAVLKLHHDPGHPRARWQLDDAKRQEVLAFLNRRLSHRRSPAAPVGAHSWETRHEQPGYNAFLYLTLPTPLVLASGIWARRQFVELRRKPAAGAVMAKSCGPEPRRTWRQPLPAWTGGTG